MALTPKQNLRDQDYNGLDLQEVLKIQLLQDASNGDEAVRLSQAQTLSGDAAQDILITDPANASNTTAYTSLTMNTLLAAKQDNMSHLLHNAFLARVMKIIKVLCRRVEPAGILMIYLWHF